MTKVYAADSTFLQTYYNEILTKHRYNHSYKQLAVKDNNMVSKRNPVPFGSNSKRFGKLCLHPALDSSGMYSDRPPACDPGRYTPRPAADVYKLDHKDNKQPWRYKAELEEWAQNLGYRNQKILERKAYTSSILGPAWHDVKLLPSYEPACKNLVFSRTPRFSRSHDRLPGPGTYFRAKPYRAPHGPHSTRPTIEREEPCRFKDSVPKWSLAPNRYIIVDKDCIAYKPNRAVSKRGPYDLFTGPRDGSTIKNHFSTSMKVHPETWPWPARSTLDKYNKSHFGTMNKTGREVPHAGRIRLVTQGRRRPEEPGPANYPVDVPPKPCQQNKQPFNSSYDKGPGYRRAAVWPAVGRYTPGARAAVPGGGHRHVFLSKVPRTIGAILPQPMNSF